MRNPAYSHFVYKYGPPSLPNVGDCAGSEFAAVQGCAILSSYLVLFISFYRKTYAKASAKRDIKNALKKANGQDPKRGRSDSLINAGVAADSLFDETCGPAGVVSLNSYY